MEKITIGKYEVSKDAIGLYVQHFGKDKSDLWEWEEMRTELHNNIFKSLKIDRHSDKGQEFSDTLDKYCIPKIERYDKIAAAAKELSCAKDEAEIKLKSIMLEVKANNMARAMAMGFRQPTFADDEKGNICRVCNVDIDGPKVNDHLAHVPDFPEIHQPICFECHKNKPDAYNIAFTAKYWSKR